MNVTKGVWIDA